MIERSNCNKRAKVTLQEQGLVGASSDEEAKVMATLRKYIAKLGGQLEPGWRCQVRKRSGPGTRVDTYFISPAGVKFRQEPFSSLF